MFSPLPPFAPPTDEAREQANQLGARGGLLDARDGQTNRINPDNPNMTAGVSRSLVSSSRTISHVPRRNRSSSKLIHDGQRICAPPNWTSIICMVMAPTGRLNSTRPPQETSNSVSKSSPDPSESPEKARCDSTSHAIPTRRPTSPTVATTKTSFSVSSTWPCYGFTKS